MSRRLLIIAAAVAVLVIGAGLVIYFTLGGGAGQNVSYNLTVTGDKMTPTGHLTAKQGDHVTITIAVDKKEEIHLHGYEKHFEAEPGKPVTQSFTADKTGTFPIEIEDTSKEVGELVVSPR